MAAAAPLRPSVTGTFAGATGLDYAARAETGRELQVRADATGVTLRAFQFAAGDADYDYDVDGRDILRANNGGKYNQGPSAATWAQGDFDNDGDYDGRDILLLNNSGRYNQGNYDTAPAAAATPFATSTVITTEAPAVAEKPAAKVKKPRRP